MDSTESMRSDVGCIASHGESRNVAFNRIANNLRGSLVNKGLLLAMSLVALDSLLVAHYQADVALALIRWTPPLSLLEGVLVNVMPVGVPVIVSIMVLRAAIQLAGVSAGSTYVGTGFTSLLTALGVWLLARLLVPAGMVASSQILASIGISVVGLLLSAKGWARVPELLGRGLCWLAVVVALMGLAITVAQSWGANGQIMQQKLAQPWVPAEEIRWRGSTEHTVGYVLSLSDGWAAVLDEGSRQILLRPVADIQGRRVCLVGAPSLPEIRMVPDALSVNCPR